MRLQPNILEWFRARRVHTPTVLQMEITECGAAALGIILGYYGRIVPLVELRQACSVSRDGVSALNILQAAQHYGLNAEGLKKLPESLKALTPPYIVFWKFNHFLVIEGFGRRGVYVNDPVTGRRVVSSQEFDESYTGIVLLMEPGTEFRPGGTKRNVVTALMSRLRYSRRIILFCLLAGLLLTLPRLAVPAFSQIFVDEILIANRSDWLRPLLLGMVATTILRAWLARLRLTSLRRLMLKLSVTMSGQFLWHSLRLPIEFYTHRYAGEISSRVPLNDKVADVLSGRLATTVIDTIMMFFFGLIMLQYDRVLTSIAVGYAVLNLLALRYLSESRVDANLKLAQDYGRVIGTAIAEIQTIETIKASGLESSAFTKFAGHYAKAINAQQELALQTQILTLLPTLLTNFATASILIVGGWRVMDGNLTIGMLIAYQSLMGSFLEPINSLINFGSVLQDLEADLDRLDDVLQNPIDPEVTRDAERAGEDMLIYPAPADSHVHLSSIAFRLRGHVELRNVTFGYSRSKKPLIENFNLKLNPGQRIAIAGSTGSGKSTVAKLICGLYAPWEGEILLDGIPRTQIPRSVLGSALAMVEQDIFLFAGTVRENLTLWNPTVPEADLVRACQDAAIDQVIRALPGGYDAKLIEGGLNLSGGQRQRLEIARALVRNPAVLVLDEATSALDAQTELIVNQNLRRRGCSCVVIAHRLNTIQDCDQTIILEP